MDSPLLEHIEALHTTKMGEERIQKNLGLENTEVIAWCRSKILDKNAVFVKKGKNWYVHISGCVLTVNASSYTVITAHRES